MIRIILSAIGLIILLESCDLKEERKLTALDSLRIKLLKEADSLDQIIEIKPITYSTFIWKSRSSYNKLIQEFGDSTAKIILSLNRVDLNNLKRNDTLVVPDSISKNMLLYSPFPLALNSAAEIPKILFISQTIQAFAAYEYGVQVKWGPTSTGKRTTPTPNGLFHTNWKAKETISTVDDEWLLKWSFNIDNFNGISIHQYAMPGYPASHSCARLLEADARWLYYWAQQWVVTKDEEDVIAFGTPVIIFGSYTYGGRRPWRQMPEDPNTLKISEKELEKELTPYFFKIIQRQVERDSVIARRDSIRGAAQNQNM